jgi:hypothetical protein
MAVVARVAVDKAIDSNLDPRASAPVAETVDPVTDGDSRQSSVVDLDCLAMAGQHHEPASESAKERNKLLHREACLADQGAQSALGEFPMIRNGQASMRRLRLPQDNVAAPLTIDLVPKAAKDSDRLSARNARQGTHTATSMTSSWIDGGMGSLRARRLST